ncbi:MAG: hypothetical protein H7Z15_13560 [Rhizobacter sp.]|nr:hypothetical protein [Rhizobacter sp.]
MRAIAFFLVLALAWAGIATQDSATLSAVGGDVDCVQSADTQPKSSGGERQIDGQPMQAQAETLADQPGLFLVGPSAHPPALTMTRPKPYASASLLPPYLDGPQRPPCATPLVA